VATGLLFPSGALTSRGGVRRWNGNEMKVSATGPATMQVTVAPGVAWVPGGFSNTQGSYAVVNNTTVSLGISSAPASQSRIDLVVLQVLDSGYSGSVDQAQLNVIVGTPASSPVPPAVAGNFIILAQVRVSAGVSSIASSAITDVRPYLAGIGGVLPVKNATERTALGSSLPTGSEVLEIDTGRIYQSGFGTGGWLYTRGGTPPVTWVNVTSLKNGWHLYTDNGTFWQAPRYCKKPDGTVELQGIIAAGSVNTMFTLPAGYRPNLWLIFPASVGTNIDAYGRVDVAPNGDVVYKAPSNCGWVSVSGIRFTADA
jgi:hypothetical protein